MKKKDPLHVLDTIAGIVMYVFAYVLIQYILACFYFSFHAHVLSIFLIILNTSMITLFREGMARIVKSPLICYAFLILSIAIVAILLLVYGYFPVSTVLKEVSL